MPKKDAIIGLINQPELDETGPLMHEPQAVNDRQAPGYNNDVAPNWLRGMGPGQAEGKPSFDKKRSG